MAKKLISYDDQKPGLGLPDVVEGKLSETYALHGEIPTGVVKSVNGAEPDDTGALTIATGKPDAITSPQITRIIASQDPETPLEDGDMLLIYAPPPSYFHNFTTGMAGWTDRWADSTWEVVDDATATGGKALRLTGQIARRLLTFDEADTLTDVEVVTRAKKDNPVSGGLGGGVVVRASGAAGAEQGYAAYLTSKELLIASFVGGTYNQIRSAPFAPGSNTWYWLRFRAIGSTLQVKAWADGTTEPSDWTITATDTNISGPGWVGASSGSNAYDQTWDVFGAAADGATAQKAAV